MFHLLLISIERGSIDATFVLCTLKRAELR